MKKQTPKFWAFFESTASYELMSQAQYLRWKNQTENCEFIKNMIPFETLKDAKKHLLFIFNGEIADARRNINDIRECTAKENQ